MTTLYYINLEIILLYHTYRLLYFKGPIKIISIYSIINVEKKNNNVVKNDNTVLYKLRNYTTLYQTYKLLYFEGHIKIISIHSTINVEKKQ